MTVQKMHSMSDINKNSLSYTTRLLNIILFGIAMGYFEAVVVVYLRGMFYPEGFSFPLKLAVQQYAVIEVCREAATIVMLITVAVLAGRKFWERFGYFLIMFGVWDIFYYIFLKVTINWPATVFDWDVLFLIPLPWIGPVIAPSLVALLMTAVGISMTYLIDRGYDFRPTRLSWILSIAATALILYSFMRDFDAALRQQMPQPYSYWLLVIGLILYGAAYVHVYRKTNN